MTARNFGLSRPEAVIGGDNQLPGARYREANPREYVNRYFPSGSILAEPSSPPFERSRIAQALIDIAAAFGIFALVLLLVGSIAGAIFVLFFL